MNETQNLNEKKSTKMIDLICGVVALLNIAAMFIPYAKDITEASPVEIVSLSAFQFGVSSASGKLLGNDYSVIGIVILAFLALVAILLLIWAIRSFTHHEKRGGLLASILNVVAEGIIFVFLSKAREFTAVLGVLIVLLSIAAVVLAIIQRAGKKKAKAEASA